MIYLKYNQYGVLIDSNTLDNISKNSFRANTLFLSFAQVTSLNSAINDYYCTVTFERADEAVISDLATSPEVVTISNNAVVGYKYLFNSKDITKVAGSLKVTARLFRRSDNAEITVVNQILTVSDNSTPTATTSTITEAQYTALLELINSLHLPFIISDFAMEDASDVNEFLNGIFAEQTENGFYAYIQDDYRRIAIVYIDDDNSKAWIFGESNGIYNLENSNYVKEKDSALSFDDLGAQELTKLVVQTANGTFTITKNAFIELLKGVNGIGNATQSTNGLMSDVDKQRLDAIYLLFATQEIDFDETVDNLNEVMAILTGFPENVTLIQALNGKVDKVEGKGLSTNDYDNTEKGKVASCYNALNPTKNSIDKNLYHLGAYDTIVEDSTNGSVTITRKTGYVDLGDLEWANGSGFQNVFYSKISDKLASSLGLANPKYKNLNTRMYATSLQNSSEDKCICCDYDVNKIILIKDTTYNNASAFKIAMKGVMLQYERETSYTEVKILKQPINPLDANESQIAKEEIDKGLNLLDITNVGNTTVNGITYSVSDGVISISGTASADTTIYLLRNKTLNVKRWVATAYVDGTSTQTTQIVQLASPTLNKYLNINQSRVSMNYSGEVIANDWYLVIVISNGKTFTNYKCSIMFNKGANTYQYVPYNQNKHISNDEATLLKEETIKCRNLIELQDVAQTTTAEGITYSVSNGIISISGTATASASISIPLKNSPILNGTYNISKNVNNDDLQYQLMIVNASDYSVRIQSDFGVNDGVNTVSNWTQPSMKIYFGSGHIFASGTTIKPMLVKGTEAPTTYSNYYGDIIHKKELNEVNSKIVGLFVHEIELGDEDFGAGYFINIVSTRSTAYTSIADIIADWGTKIISTSFMGSDSGYVGAAFFTTGYKTGDTTNLRLYCFFEDDANPASVEMEEIGTDTVTSLVTIANN